MSLSLIDAGSFVLPAYFNLFLLSKARGRSEAEGAPAPPQAARGYPHFVPPSFEAMQGLLAC